MVAQCKTHNRCKALIYLIALLISACSDPQVTIVDLKNAEPTDIKHIIDRFAQDDIAYDISGKKIIFYESKENLENIITLLNKVDI